MKLNNDMRGVTKRGLVFLGFAFDGLLCFSQMQSFISGIYRSLHQPLLNAFCLFLV